MLEYVTAIAYNASLAMRWSHLARSSYDPTVVEAARAIGPIALEVRLRALRAICVLIASLVFPTIRTENLLPLQMYGKLKAALTAFGAKTNDALQIAAQL